MTYTIVMCIICMCLSCHAVCPRPQKRVSARTFGTLGPLSDRLMIVRSRVTTRCCTRFYAPRIRTWRTGRTHATLRGGVKPSLYGQPQPSTHPHLFEHADELTPGIRAHEYAQRRQRLMESLPDDSVVFAIAGNIKYMSKCEFPKQLFMSYGSRINAAPFPASTAIL